jgi:hypothetical protein
MSLLGEEVVEEWLKWIEDKFDHRDKVKLRSNLCPGRWTKELVVGNVKHEEEVALLEQAGVTVHHLKDILTQIDKRGQAVKAAAGVDLCELMLLQGIRTEGGRR